MPFQLDGLRADSLDRGDRQGLPGDALRPWDNGEFTRPQDPCAADGLDAGAVLEDLWRDWISMADEDDPEWVQMRAPFTREFPGLAAPERTPLTSAERQQALDVVLPRIRQARIRQAHRAASAARIGLVAAGRPADALAVIGWAGLAPTAGRRLWCR